VPESKRLILSNRFAVGGAADGKWISIGIRPGGRLTVEEALNLAAWIVAIAGPDEFQPVLDAVLDS